MAFASFSFFQGLYFFLPYFILITTLNLRRSSALPPRSLARHVRYYARHARNSRHTRTLDLSLARHLDPSYPSPLSTSLR